MYVRYMDDIIIILSRDSVREFIMDWDLMTPSFFAIDGWEWGTSLPILDLTVTLDAVNKRVTWAPYFKPTALQIPLDTSSCHRNRVHTSWSHGYLRRLAMNSFHHASFKVAQKIFVDRLKNFKFKDEIVHSLETSDLYSQVWHSSKHPCAPG